ncbi:uncharacterized protein METZ01_LOCUS29466 [marine metagenome]|uniref:3-phosphoshikimate 1-carboxyvinyltransferase n=1 Tax=marine metagenome TaxID=408172 RepID=A0A381QBA2_9ZZZZ
MSSIIDKSILIIGLGLIGGSIARGLKKANPNQFIAAIDSNEETKRLAIDQGVIDRSGEFDILCKQSDIIILALPPIATLEFIPMVSACAGIKTVVTDVASVKSAIIESVNKLDQTFVERFVPAHPIAGSEQSGYRASTNDLFVNRNVIFTPQLNNDSRAVSLVNDLWRQLGSRVLGMSFKRHDAVLAATSHLPHLLAYATVDVLAKQEQSEDIFRYAAGGFADFSRLASSDARMWSDIFTSNSEETLKILDVYIDNLQRLKILVDENEHDQLIKIFTNAKKTRDNFLRLHFDNGSRLSAELSKVQFNIEPGTQIAGRLKVPGDKSISHRAIILGSIAEGVTQIQGFLESEDTLRTITVFRELGVTIIGPENGELTIFGVGKNGLKAPRIPLYFGNSGTAMRLLTGLLAAQNFSGELIGDESLMERPMERVAEPLRSMGAIIKTADNGRPPIRTQSSALSGIRYDMPVASAQVKSSLLLAGLYAKGETTITEPFPCRDHTERMLIGFGYPLVVDKTNHSVTVSGGGLLRSADIDIPADISSAAFFMVAAAICPGSKLILQHVAVNPTRIGIINILQAMGGDIKLTNEREVGGEPVADITVNYQPLFGIEVPKDQIPLAIDEFPAIFIAAACAKGDTVLRGAAELRVKESDRIEAMANGLETLGIDNETYEDGIRITGGQLDGGYVDSQGDHRIAMAFTIAGLRAKTPVIVANCANVATSFPGFVKAAQTVGIKVQSHRSEL